MNKYKSGITLILLHLPFLASANHGVEAMGEAFELLFIVCIIYCVISILNFLIAFKNISSRLKWLRVINIIVLMPSSLLLCIAFNISVAIGSGVLLWIFLNVWIIFKSLSNGNEESL